MKALAITFGRDPLVPNNFFISVPSFAIKNDHVRSYLQKNSVDNFEVSFDTAIDLKKLFLSVDMSELQFEVNDETNAVDFLLAHDITIEHFGDEWVWHAQSAVSHGFPTRQGAVIGAMEAIAA